MTRRKFRVGIVGLSAGRSWAAVAHVPALRSLSDVFEIVGVANTSRASAEAAAATCGLPKAFDGVSDLVASPEVDIVTVTVKVPHHLEIVKAAISAGKHVYCEWPLGNGLAEAEELATLAKSKGVLGVVGNQARVAPEISYVRALLADGFVGEVLSTTLTAWGGNWGASISNPETYSYLLDRANGATMLTIPMGHTLAALRDVLGDIVELSAVVTNGRHEVRAVETGEMLPMTAPDQILVSGRLVSGAPISVHYRGGMPRDGQGLTWDINGTDGDIRITGATGHAQMVQLSLTGGHGDDQALRPLKLPESYGAGFSADVMPGNVARVYARMADDLHNNTQTAPSFDDAVELHRLLAAIEVASNNGRRLSAGAQNRPLPIS